MRAAAASRAPRRRPRGPATAAAASSPRASAAARPRACAPARRRRRRTRSRRGWRARPRASAPARRRRRRTRSRRGWRPRRAAGFRAGFGGAGSASSLSEDDDGRGARRAAGLRRGGGASASSLSDDDSSAAGALTGAGERAAARAARADAWAAGAAPRATGAAGSAAGDRRRPPRRRFGAGASLGALEALPLLRRVARPLSAAPSCARSAAGTRSIVRRPTGDRTSKEPSSFAATIVPGPPSRLWPGDVSGATTTKSPTRNVVVCGDAAPRLAGAAAGAAARPRLAAGDAVRPRLVAGAAGDAVRPRRAGAAAGARAAARPRPTGFRRGRTVGAGAGASGCRAARQSADVGVGRELSFVASPPRRSCETRSNSSRPGWMASWRSWPLVMSLTMNGTRHSGHTYSSTVSSRRHAAQNAWPQGSISRSSWSRRSSQRRHVNAASSPAKFSVSPGSIFFPLAVRLRSSQGCMRRKKYI